MVINREPSLRAKVFRWFENHPKEVYKRSCANLYDAFEAVSDEDQMYLRVCKRDYVDTATDYWGTSKAKSLKGTGKKKEKKQKKEPDFRRYEERVPCPHCPGMYANEITKFIGFRGELHKKRHPKGSMVEVAFLDIKGEVCEGEAFPRPVVPVSRNRNLDNLMRLTGKTEQEIGHKYYIGILRYEIEIMTLIFTLREMGYENIQVLMPRGHGKTYMECWESQIDMKWFQENIMLLSETNARLKVGNWIYVWALQNGYLKDPEKFARKMTYQHFVLLNEARMDIYKFSKEELVGEHDYKIKLDDTVKKKWRSRPTENEKMIEHFQSNINMIIRTGLEDFGTRKYEGDPLQHRHEHIKDIVVIKRSPFIKCPHENLNSQDTYDPCSICGDLALLAPEIHGYYDLIDKMEEDYDAWYSEMMQDPHPKEGGMVEERDICYKRMPFFADTKLVGIGVDVAENWDDSLLADMSAVITCAMSFEVEEDKKQHRRFTFLTEDVRRMPFRTTVDKHDHETRGIIETIDKAVKFLQENFINVSIIIAIERNGPGIVLIEQILREWRDWPWYRKIISSKTEAVKWIKQGKANVPLGISHPTEKIPRINSELRHSIKQGQTRFTYNLEDTTFMTQLLSFPKGKHDDGPDAGGMIKDELNKRWTTHHNRDPKEDPDLTRVKRNAKAKFQDMEEPWKKIQASASRKNQYSQGFKKRVPRF